MTHHMGASHVMRLRKHATASVYVISESEEGGGRRIVLVNHPRFGRWTVPGGHVEGDENAAEAGLREVQEETGLEVRLIPSRAMLPPGEVTVGVAVPHWIFEYQVPEDREPWPHVHVDHVYVAVVVGAGRPVEDLGMAWYGPDELEGLRMFKDSRA